MMQKVAKVAKRCKKLQKDANIANSFKNILKM